MYLVITGVNQEENVRTVWKTQSRLLHRLLVGDSG